MEELKEMIASFPRDEGIRYFYHITSTSGEDILEQGLVVANPRWDQSFLEFTDEELDNIQDVIDDNQSTKLKQNNTIMIAALYEDDIDIFIRPMEGNASNWEGVGSPEYVVVPEHFVGYIDLQRLEFILNEYANVALNIYRGF